MYVIAVTRKWNLKIVLMSNLGILKLKAKSTAFPVSKIKRIGKQSIHSSNGLQRAPLLHQRHSLLMCDFISRAHHVFLILCSSPPLGGFFPGKKVFSSLPQENTLISGNKHFKTQISMTKSQRRFLDIPCWSLSFVI